MFDLEMLKSNSDAPSRRVENSPRGRGRSWCAPRYTQQPFLPSVITETGLDFHRYIYNDLFAGTVLVTMASNTARSPPTLSM